MQSAQKTDEDAPRPMKNVPARHFTHDAELDAFTEVEYVPSIHLMHTVNPDSEKEPAVQFRQIDANDSLENVPAEQF